MVELVSLVHADVAVEPRRASGRSAVPAASAVAPGAVGPTEAAVVVRVIPLWLVQAVR